MDLLLDSDGDIVFLNGQCPVTQDPAEVVAQRLTIRLKTFLGEWFINVNYGIPYWQRILAKKASKEAIDRIFQQEILSERGVLELTTFSSTLVNREYSATFRVRAANNIITNEITIGGVTI